MSISNLSERGYNFAARRRVSKSVEPVKTEKKNNNRNKRLYYGAGIAGVLLLSLLFRKQIKNIFFKTKPDIADGKIPGQIDPSKIQPSKLSKQEEINIAEGEKLLKKYRELLKEFDEIPTPVTPEEKEIYKAKKELVRECYRELTDKNISMVEKKEFSIDPTQDVEAKKQYLHKLTSLSVVNEASQKDCLDMYEKYGFRYWLDEDCDRSFIRDLSLVATPCKFSDKEYVIKKFLDIAEKTTECDPLGMRDGNKVMVMYELHGFDMDENTTLRFINLMKKLSFQKLDATVFEIRTQNKSTPAIKQAIEELKEATKNFPEVDNFKNT